MRFRTLTLVLLLAALAIIALSPAQITLAQTCNPNVRVVNLQASPNTNNALTPFSNGCPSFVILSSPDQNTPATVSVYGQNIVVQGTAVLRLQPNRNRTPNTTLQLVALASIVTAYPNTPNALTIPPGCLANLPLRPNGTNYVPELANSRFARVACLDATPFAALLQSLGLDDGNIDLGGGVIFTLPTGNLPRIVTGASGQTTIGGIIPPAAFLNTIRQQCAAGLIPANVCAILIT